MRELIVSGEHFRIITEHCRACWPNEACGILSGREGRVSRVYPMTNIEPSPVSYFMEPAELFSVQKEIRSNGEQMTAIFHSHPNSQAYPSSKDVGLAFYDDAIYLIIGLGEREIREARAFSIVDDRIEEASLKVVD